MDAANPGSMQVNFDVLMVLYLRYKLSQKDGLVQGQRGIRTGIAGIEKTIQAQQSLANVHISKAFEDLSSLMKMAKDTVGLSRTIVAKVKNRQGEITDDETTQLKAYLLSLGVDDPVTRDVCGNDNVYHQKLAREISDLMVKPLKV